MKAIHNQYDAQATKDILNQSNIQNFATGLPNYDNYFNSKIPAIQQQALNILKTNGEAAAMAYLSGATSNLANLHSMIAQKMQAEIAGIGALKKQDAAIDADGLGVAVRNTLNNSFQTDANGNAVIPTANLLSSNIADNLNATGNYRLGAPGLINAIAKTKTTDSEQSYHNGLGGGYSLKTRTNPYTYFDKNGQAQTYTQSILSNPNDPHSRKIILLDEPRYNILMNSTPSAQADMNYLYNKAIAGPQNEIYTDPTSPYYQMTPQQLGTAQHPEVADYGKRYIAKQLISRLAPAQVLSNSRNADHIYASQVGGGGNRGSSDSGEGYYNTAANLNGAIAQDYIVSEVNKRERNPDGSRIALSQLQTVTNPDGTHSVYPAGADTSKTNPIFSFNNEEINLATNPKRKGVQTAIHNDVSSSRGNKTINPINQSYDAATQAKINKFMKDNNIQDPKAAIDILKQHNLLK